MPTGVVALQAQLHQILERVYHKGRYTEGWNAHGLPFRELPAGGTVEDRIVCGVTGAAHTRVITTHG